MWEEDNFKKENSLRQNIISVQTEALSIMGTEVQRLTITKEIILLWEIVAVILWGVSICWVLIMCPALCKTI